MQTLLETEKIPVYIQTAPVENKPAPHSRTHTHTHTNRHPILTLEKTNIAHAVM